MLAIIKSRCPYRIFVLNLIADQYAIIFFVFTLTNYCYYLNNVKAFYVSILTSHLFRQTFIKGFIGLLPRRARLRFQASQTYVVSMATVTQRC
jgi:hypothetical protein